MKKTILAIFFLASCILGHSQVDSKGKSNILKYTPSKLLEKGQIDIKWFNNLYTQTKSTFNDSKDRESFFTTSIDFFTGISNSNRVNIGILIEARSNIINNKPALDVLKFGNDDGTSRSGLGSFAPAIKFNPIKKVSNFTIQSAFHIPLIDQETENGVYLDQKGYIFQNRFFYDYTFPGNKWQLFAEINTEYNFGDEDESFANNSLNLGPGIFFSYFPSQKFTVLVLAQHLQRFDLGNEFSQDFTAIGAGAKYQLTDALNIEFLQTNFVRGNNTGLGQTYNFGLRSLF